MLYLDSRLLWLDAPLPTLQRLREDIVRDEPVTRAMVDARLKEAGLAE